MANLGIILLVTFVIILGIGVIIILILAAISAHNLAVERQKSGGTGATGTNPCSQNVNISDLVQIPDTGANCLQSGATGSLYYIGKITNGVWDFVVAPWGTQPSDVCTSFCSSYSNGTCTGAVYNGVSAQTNYNECIQQLSSTSCTPPVPIAAKGTILYYANSPTCRICDNCAA